MSATTSIEWTDKTWNPTLGCTIKSAGCTNCYAMREAWMRSHNPNAKIKAAFAGTAIKRNGVPIWSGQVNLLHERLADPLSWRKPCRVFVDSMSDLFWGDEDDLKQALALGVVDPQPVPFEFIDEVFAVMALCPQHTFQILTKRPARMAEYFAGMNPSEHGIDDGDVTGTDIAHRLSAAAGTLLDGEWIHDEGKRHRKAIEAFITDCIGEADGFDEDEPDRAFKPVRWPLPNVWLGTSAENKQSADERQPYLERCPAAVRFLSLEPLLGPVEFSHVTNRSDALLKFGKKALDGIDWVIVGGESGPCARPMHPHWARSIRDQCAAAGVPFFFKQHGDYLHGTQWPNYGGFAQERINAAFVHADGSQSFRVGKKAAGRLLDGREHNDMPAMNEARA